MGKGRTFSIFAVIVLAAALCLVVGGRARLGTKVVIDGGTNVRATAQPEGTAGLAVPSSAPSAGPALPQIDTTSWELVLVNKNNSVKGTPKVSVIGKTGAYFDTRALDALNQMTSACRAAGYSPHINLAYVPYSAEEYYYNKKASQLSQSGTVTDDDRAKAARTVAPPGQSEHETGLAVDITDQYCIPYTSETISPNMLSWLVKHCAEYGFIQRYPAGKDNITGYRETYHFRYVGRDAAAYIMDNGLCLEEFLALYK